MLDAVNWRSTSYSNGCNGRRGISLFDHGPRVVHVEKVGMGQRLKAPVEGIAFGSGTSIDPIIFSFNEDSASPASDVFLGASCTLWF